MARQTERSPQSEDWGYEILPYAESVRRGNAAIEALDRNMEAFALYERDSDPTVSNGIARDVSGSDASATPKTPSSEHDRHVLDVVVGPPEAQALHDLDLEMNPGMRHLHWVTDPDSDYMRAKARRDRENQITLIDILIRQDREAAAKFEETYGESMKNAAVAYKQVGRDGYYNAERRAIKEESRLQIASGIAEGIEQQPAEERVAWVNGILEFIDAR